jgi:hypothetical protein
MIVGRWKVRLDGKKRQHYLLQSATVTNGTIGFYAQEVAASRRTRKESQTLTAPRCWEGSNLVISTLAPTVSFKP